MKKYWGRFLVSEKTEGLFTELNETVKADTRSYSATGNLFSVFILCLWVKIIRESNLGVKFVNFSS